MKICIIDTFRDHSASAGGHAYRVATLAHLASNAGHHVTIVRPGDRTSDYKDGQVSIRTIATNKGAVRALRRLQTRMFPLNPGLVDSIVMNLPSSLLRLYPILRSADIVQVEDPTLLGILAIARISGRPCVSDNDGIASEVFRFNFRNSNIHLGSLLIYSMTLCCERLSSQLSSRIVASTPDDMELMSRIHRIPENKMAVVPNPVDGGFGLSRMDKNQARVQLGFPLAIPIAVFVGDLTSPHNLEAVSHIAFMLSNNRDLEARGLQVMVIGRFEKVLPEWKIPRLIFTGPVKDLSQYFRAADFCIAPLVSQPTGIKTKILTYLAFGKTTVATPIALSGLDATLRKHVIESDIENFPAILLQYIDTLHDNDAGTEISRRVISMYGHEKIGQVYQEQVLQLVNRN